MFAHIWNMRSKPGAHGSKETLIFLKMSRNAQSGQSLASPGPTMRNFCSSIYHPINQLENVDPENYFKMAANQHNHATRQAANLDLNGPVPSSNLAKPNARLELRRNFFTHRVVNGWNDLDESVKSAETLNEFKNKYDAELV